MDYISWIHILLVNIRRLIVTEYSFFYDEASHSRKITKETVNDAKFSPFFVAVITGYKNENNKSILNNHKALEEKFKSIRHLSELKSKTIETEQFKWGFKSINKNNIFLVDEYLDFFIQNNLYIYIAVINKIEYVVNQLLKDYKNSFFLDADSLRYSVTKLISTYNPPKVYESIFNNDNTFIKSLIEFANTQRKLNGGLEHKEVENKIIDELLVILSGYNKSFIIDWSYEIAFIGFKEYLKETNKTQVSLVIDKEGCGKTLLAAKRIGFINAIEIDSKESHGIRISDMIAGLISKLIVSIEKDLRYDSIDQIVSLKLLSSEWFDIDDKRFNLYKKLHHVVNIQNSAWYKTYSGNYSDAFIYFQCILNYFASFKDLNELKSIDNFKQQTNLNNYALDQLHKRFDMMKFKLPIEFVEKNKKDYYYNKKGAKTYFDFRKHSILPMFESNKNKNSSMVYNVLSVGFFGNMEQPCLTVDDKGTPVCYLLPMQLLDWTIYCIGIANMGEDLFPCFMEFGIQNGRQYAEFKL